MEAPTAELGDRVALSENARLISARTCSRRTVPFLESWRRNSDIVMRHQASPTRLSTDHRRPDTGPFKVVELVTLGLYELDHVASDVSCEKLFGYNDA